MDEKLRLVVIQFCLNEIPLSSHPQLIRNMMRIVDLMKRGALMLVIERPYRYVKNFLQDFQNLLTNRADRIHIIRRNHEHDLKDLNRHSVPAELTTFLFLQNFNSGLWLANQIKYDWLAISKPQWNLATFHV